MRFYRGLGAIWKDPTKITTAPTTLEPTTCPPIDGFTWDSANGGYWRRLKVGETPQAAPKIPGQPCGTVDVRQHCALPGGSEVDCTTLHTSAELTGKYREYLSEQNARAVAVTEAIRIGGWLTQQANIRSCAFWRGRGSASKTEPWLAQQGFDILTPPGVINIYGIPFPVEELKAGTLTRTLTPTPEQRLLIDWAVYVKSQALVAGLLAGKGCGKNVDVNMDHTWGSYTNQDPAALVLRAIADHGANGSIRAIVLACDGGSSSSAFTTYIDGYSLNPVQPTNEEWNDAGGLRRYYERGGFLLSQAVVNGKIKADSAASQGGFPTGIRYSIGYGLCPDPTSDFWNIAVGRAYQPGDFAQGGTPISVVQGNDGDGKGWNVWVLNGRSASSPTKGDHYTVSITPTDIGNVNKVIGAIAKVMDSIYKLICTLAPVSQPIAQETLLKELCVDGNGKTCAKGSPGCKCTQPSTAQKDAVGVGTAVMNYACGKLAETNQPIPPPPAQLPPPPPVVTAGWTPPWWLIGLAGLGAGAAAFSARRKR